MSLALWKEDIMYNYILLPNLGHNSVALVNYVYINSLQNNKILVQIECICRRHINVKEKLQLGLGKVENIVGKGENAGCPYFLLFPQCFQKSSVSGFVKKQACVVNSKRTNVPDD